MGDPLIVRFQHRLRIDRKGLGLLLMGTVWFLTGVGASDPPHLDSVLHFYLPAWVNILIWCIAGVGAFIAAWIPQIRPWVMAALTVGPATRFFGYSFSWLVSLFPEGRPGYERGWLSALVYLVMIGFVFYVAADNSDHNSIEKLNSALSEEE